MNALRRMVKTTQLGRSEQIAEWDVRTVGQRQLKSLTSTFNRILESGYFAADVHNRRDVLITEFDPRADIVFMPRISGGGLQTFQETLTQMNTGAIGTTFATFTTAKTVIPATNLITLPANWFYVGRALVVEAWGAISNIVTTPGLMNFQVVIGGVAAFDTGNIQLNATAHTTLPFNIRIKMRCAAVGATTTANLLGLAIVTGRMFTLTAGQTDSAQEMPTVTAPATNPAVGTGFNSTIANIMDFFVGFTSSNAANLIRIDDYTVTALN